MRKTTSFVLMFISLFSFLPASAQQYGVTTEALEQNTPDGWTAVELPQLPAITTANTFDITNYGASTSSEDNAKAIQKALDAVPSTGGMVVIPEGTWLSGPIKMSSKTILHLAKGATLKLLPLGKYPGSENYLSTTSKVNLDNFIDVKVKNKTTDLVIEGEDKESSVIDGQGADWWALRDKGGEYKTAFENMKRGAVIRFTSGSRFLVKNFSIKNAPGVNITIGNSGKGDNGTVHDVIIRAPKSTLKYSESNTAGQNPSHNTDGIPVWAAHVNIYNCDISTGDDNVVIDSNGQYVHVWNCTFGSGHGGSIGSYTVNVHDILFEDITFNGTESGFKIKSQRGRSGSVHDITFRNSTMTGVVGNPIALDCWYDGQPSSPEDATRQDSTDTTPYYHNILFQNITSTGTPYNKSSKNYFPVYIYGLPESYVGDITFDNVRIEAGKGMYMAYCRGIKFINGCKITNTTDASTYFETKYNASVTGDYTGNQSTAINKLTALSETNYGTWYTVGGQRLTGSPKHGGIYIHNGKKDMVK